MPDIILCFGKGCKIKKTCYRYMAKPDKYRQSYIQPDPKGCDYYWKFEFVPANKVVKK